MAPPRVSVGDTIVGSISVNAEIMLDELTIYTATSLRNTKIILTTADVNNYPSRPFFAYMQKRS